jgi:hypothetical protein
MGCSHNVTNGACVQRGSASHHLRTTRRQQAPERGCSSGDLRRADVPPYCSGTLISPSVFLTAAHRGDDGSTVYVTFDSTYTSKSKLYTGTFYSNALYPGPQDDPYDIAVVVFDKPIRGIEPAQLPTLGQFDQVDKNQQFTAVAHGGQEAVNGPGGPVIGYLDTREYAVSTFNAVGPSYLRLSQNPATGNGGPATATRAAPTSWALARPRPTSSLVSRSPAMRCASPPT